MTVPAADLLFEDALTIFETQVGEATQFWFAASTMNEVANVNVETLSALNLTPTFWLTARVAMEYQAILSVGKIFGPRKTNPYNIDSLFQVLHENRLAVFSRDAFAARKRRRSANADEWLPQFMESVHVPEPQDFETLRALSKPHRRTYETQWEQIRNQHVAHTGIVDPNARWKMFQKTKIADLEQLIVFLNEFTTALRRTYYDGRQPTLEPLPACSVQSLVAKKLEDLSWNRTQEHIVAETRKCMFLITQAAGALPAGYKRSGTWA